jgi:hypothetical protein
MSWGGNYNFKSSCVVHVHKQNSREVNISTCSAILYTKKLHINLVNFHSISIYSFKIIISAFSVYKLTFFAPICTRKFCITYMTHLLSFRFWNTYILRSNLIEDVVPLNKGTYSGRSSNTRMAYRHFLYNFWVCGVRLGLGTPLLNL